MKNLFILTTFSILILIQTAKVYAQGNSAGPSAALLKPTVKEITDSRVRILREFLEKYNSPLVSFAGTFVETADKYNLDWKFVVAISGVESTFGREIPYNSYNGWGWGIYGNNIIRFSSWKEGIQTVSEGLRTNFIDKWGAKDTYEIGKLYAASPTWAQRVEYFMNSIEKYGDLNLASLPISL